MYIQLHTLLHFANSRVNKVYFVKEDKMAPTLKLKKYANRRLYDTEKSAYVTLNEVATIIRQGRQIRVADARTGEDVTAFVLTQIVMEETRKNNALLPIPLLHLAIRYGDNLLADFFENYLQQIMQMYLLHKKHFENRFAQWLDMGMGFANKSGKAMSEASPFNSFFELFGNSPYKNKNQGTETIEKVNEK